MTDEKKLQKARKEIIKQYKLEQFNRAQYENPLPVLVKTLDDKFADAILAIDGIEVRSDDQSEPAINETGDYIRDLENLHIAYKEDNFIKRVIKK